MGLGRRAGNLLRAYIGREWDRIQGISEASAHEELEEYLNDPEVRARIAAASKPAKEKTDFEIALEIFGLSRNSSLADLKREYKRLHERSLPSRFAAGSEERAKAETIHASVQWAYDTLLPQFDPRLKRFQSLDV